LLRASCSVPGAFGQPTLSFQSGASDRLGDPNEDRPDVTCLRIGRRCRLRSRCWLLWRRRLGCRCRCGLWRSRRSGFWRWCRRWRGFRGWRRRWCRCRCRGFSLWWLDLGGFALVPVHEIGSNDESEHNASQDDSEERPTAGLVVVCHSLSPSRGSLVQTGRAYRFLPPGSRVGPGKAPISGAYAQGKGTPAQATTTDQSVGCRPRLKSGVSPIERAKFTITEYSAA
jgi:hypothetical protein